MNKIISFHQLRNEQPANTLVWTALIMRDEDIEPMNNWFKEIGLIRSSDNLLNWKKVGGNVLGDKGRSDILLIFNEDVVFNPRIRLQLGREVKWTCDFCSNFNADYGF